MKRAKVRRAKLYFIREKVARELKRIFRRTTLMNVATKGSIELEAERKVAEEEEAKRQEAEAKRAAEEEARSPSDEATETPAVEAETVDKEVETTEEAPEEAKKDYTKRAPKGAVFSTH